MTMELLLERVARRPRFFGQRELKAGVDAKAVFSAGTDARDRNHAEWRASWSGEEQNWEGDVALTNISSSLSLA